MPYDFESLQKRVEEAIANPRYYTDFEDVDPNILHEIQELLNFIRTKGSGRAFREAVAQLFERYILTISSQGNANLEVSAARGTYKTLNDRLDIAFKDLKDSITAIGDGSPRGTYPSLSSLQSAYPIGTTGIFVTTDNGHWYYYNAGWKDGGVYQSAGEEMREQFRGINYILEQVIYRSKNIFDTSNALSGCYISDNTGKVMVNESFSSYYFPVDATQKLSFNSVFVDSRITWVSSSQDMSKYSVGDVINGFISATANTAVQNVSPPAGAVGVVVSIPTAKATLAQVEYGSVSTAYEPYKIGIDSDKILGREVSNLTVGSDKMYATIQSAVDASKDGDTITIYPGTYREAVDARYKLVNLVGVSKKLCVLEYPNGAYSKPPLEIAKGSVTNLTIRATAQEKVSGEVAKAYAVHIDFEQQLGYDLKFENVHFINEDYQTLGIGLRNNSSLEFVNCMIESDNHNAFYCHSQPNSTAADGQNLLVKNCTIINNSSSFCTIKMQSQPYEAAVAIATFQGNIVVNRGSAKLVEMILYGNHSDVSHNGWLGSTEWQLGIASATNNVDILNT